MPLRRLAAAAVLLVLAGCGQPVSAPETETLTRSEAALVLDTPQESAAARSPLVVEGEAPADWFFENQFPTLLMDDAGRVLAEAPAIPLTPLEGAETMVRFKAQLPFVVSAETPATLVLQEDMPREDEPAREVRLSVTLLPPLR